VLNSLQQVGKLVGAPPPTLIKAQVLVALAIGDGPVEDASGVTRFFTD